MIITTKFHGPTNNRGARISATLNRRARHTDKRDFSVAIPFDYIAGGGANGSHRMAAEAVIQAWNAAVIAVNPGVAPENMSGIIVGLVNFVGELGDAYVYAMASEYGPSFEVEAVDRWAGYDPAGRAIAKAFFGG